MQDQLVPNTLSDSVNGTPVTRSPIGTAARVTSMDQRGQPPVIQHRVAAERIWALGLQFQSHPKEIMTEVLKTFRDLDIGWKKTGAYNVKCRWLAPTSSSGDAAPTPGGITDPPIAGSMYRPSSSDCWTADMHGDPNAQTKDSNVAGILSNLVKFELQVHFIYFAVHWLSLIYKEAAH
jgi:5'-AMP-activated protein kinase catalytic alpha subunit